MMLPPNWHTDDISHSPSKANVYGLFFMNSPLDERAADAFPILRTIDWTLPRQSEDSFFNILGARTRQHYLPPHWIDRMSWIAPNEDMFEWVAIVETIHACGQRYVMADLGAGYGRWIVNAALLARRLGRIPFVIGVEAEDTHFSWMKQHLVDNQIFLSEQRLVHAPIMAKRQDVPFTLGHAKDWYGQAVLSSPDVEFGNWPNAKVAIRPTIIIEDVIGDKPIVDLLDLDVQGMEADIVSSSIDLIAQRVKRIHIGTHSHEIEGTLRRLMTAVGWKPRFDYPCASANHPTPAGPVDFGDGVQDWVNPNLA